jgi:peptidoglycan/xylan/chitin deacetylase (PgdA/CDA1 family)
VPPPNVPESTLRLAGYKASSKQFVAAAGGPPRVALTFDAGSDAKAVPLILKTLKEHNVRATFFLTGQFCKRYPAACRAIAEASMELGNHSFSHPHFTKLSDAEILNQLMNAEIAIRGTCGRGARPLFRFPFGDSDKRTRDLVAKAGYQAIYWTLDSLDSVGKPKPPDFVANRITARVKGGYITLMHVSCLGSAQALPRIFAHLDKRGAKVVPVSDLLLTPPPPASHPKHIARR